MHRDDNRRAGEGVVSRAPFVEELVNHLVARRSIVLCGPAGIGKSHVAGVVAGRLGTMREIAVRRVAGGEAQRHLDFGALLHFLPLDGTPITAEFELVQRLRQRLVEHAIPTVVVVDDVGMLDTRSAGVIESLLRSGDIAVLATERTLPDGERESEHQLTAALRDHADTITVGPLADDDIAELLLAWQGPGEVGSIRRLTAMSEGNPLALRELLASAVASSAISHRDGLWHLDSFVPGGRSLVQLVGSHLQRLSDPEWDLLRAIAIAGSVPRQVLARLDLDALERLERAGLVVNDPCTLDHPLYAQVIRGELVGEETRRLYSKLASAVGPQDGVDPARLAEWMLDSESGIDDRTARLGAAVAVGRWENALARRLIGAIASPTVADLVQLVWAHANAGDLEQAERTADQAVAAAESETERVDAGLARAELWSLQLGRSDDGYEQLRVLRDSLTQADQLARVDGATALYMRMTGKGSLAHTSTTAAHANDVTSDVARLSVVLADAFGQVFAGKFLAAGAAIVEGYELAERSSAPHNTVRLGITDALRHLLVGDFDRAHEVIDRWLRLADISLVRPAHAVWLGLDSNLAALEGDGTRGILRGREAVRAADHVDDIGAGGFVRGELRAMRVEFGIDAPRHPLESPLGRARAELRLAADADVDASAATLTRQAIDAGYVLWAPWIGMEAVRRGLATNTAPIVVEAAAGVDGPLVEGLAEHARGWIDGDLARLAHAVELLLAAGATAPALDALITETELAVVRIAASGARPSPDPVDVRRHVLAARSLASRMTPHVPPRIAARLERASEAIDMPSERQLEIARLVAAGRTSKEVAAQLIVSARTVDNHLAAVYRQLGVSGRQELADLPL